MSGWLQVEPVVKGVLSILVKSGPTPQMPTSSNKCKHFLKHGSCSHFSGLTQCLSSCAPPGPGLAGGHPHPGAGRKMADFSSRLDLGNEG